jgi:hypothetical protein
VEEKGSGNEIELNLDNNELDNIDNICVLTKNLVTGISEH